MAALLPTGQHPLMTFRIGHSTATALRSPPPPRRPRPAPMTGTLYRTRRIGLVVAAALYAWVGISAHGIRRILGLPGALLILGALAVTSRSRAVAAVLLLLGALPLAVSSWWSSAATPLLAVLRVLPGWPQRSRTTGAKTLPG
jgi:hypothetical protein